MPHQKTLELQKRILEYIQHNMPIEGINGNTITLDDLSFKDPEGLNNIQKQLDMKYSGKGSLEGWLRGRVIIKNAKGKVSSKGTLTNLIPIPYMTDRGTFLINGSEKSILGQMRLKPGSYTTKNTDKNEIKTQLMFAKGIKAGQYMPRIDILFKPAESEFKIIVNSRPAIQFNGINFLRQLSFTDAEISRMLGNNSVSNLMFEKYGSKNTKSISDIYKSLFGKVTSASPQIVRQDVFDYFRDNALFQSGSAVIQTNLGVKKDTSFLSKEIISKAVQKTFAVARSEEKQDTKDDIKYKDILDDTDLLMEQVEKDIDEFIKKSKERLAKPEDELNANALTPVLKLGDSIKRFLSESTLVQIPEETNPLFINAMNRKITQLGEGGLSSEAAASEFGARNLTVNGINKVDPIETPESGNVGFVQHLTQAATIKDRTIYIPVYKVRGGEATVSDSNKKQISTIEDYNAKIAFYDTRFVKRNGNKLEFTASEVPGRYLGKMLNLRTDEVQYIDTSPQNVLGATTNMIPFVMHNDGSRALMGANMQKQAVLLKNREAPLVTTLANHETGETYDESIGKKQGKPVYSDVNGTVKNIDDNSIDVVDEQGNKHEYPFYHYYPLNQSFINNELQVKVGDKVIKGQMIAEGWQTKDGKLALGKNTRVGYLALDGHNYEDGIVISQSYSKEMMTDESEDFTIEIPKDFLGGRGSSIQEELNAYTSNPEVKQRLDKDGIIKVGEYVKPGSILIAALRPLRTTGRSASMSDIIKATDKNQKYEFKPFKIESSSYVEGKVERVTIIESPDANNRQKIILTLVSSKSLKIGDKVSGRHGNKGTITKILPDNLMPTAEDGHALQLLFSPLTVPSRKNPGQLFEVNAGLIAEKTGKRFVVDNFNHNEKERVLKGLKEIGYVDGKMKVFLKKEQDDGSIKDIATENPITVGNMYIMKLKHKVDDKIQSRSNLETAPGLRDNMPSKKVGTAKGEKHNPQSLGEMEMRALQGHGAVWNILESSTIKADGGGDNSQRIAMFKAMSTGKLDHNDLDVSATPESMRVMADSLKALGMNVRPLNNGKVAANFDDVFDSIGVTPMKSSEFLKMVGSENEVHKHDLFNARDLYDSKKSRKKTDDGDDTDMPGLTGGLLDPKIFGMPGSAEQRSKWGYIKLATPMANPILMQDRQYNPYSILTGMSASKLQELMNGKKVMIIDPKTYSGFKELSSEQKKIQIASIQKSMKDANVKVGDLLKPDELEGLMSQHGSILWKAGGEGLQNLLDNVDLDKELANAKSNLDESKGEKIDAAYKRYRTLLTLKNNGTNPSDLMMQYMPVSPAYLRPVTPDKNSGTIIINDLNKLYANLIKANNGPKSSVDNGFDMMRSLPPTEAAKATGNIYLKMTNLTGHVQGKDMKNKKRDLKGLKSELGGKNGRVRGQMLSKRVDFSGRSVIGVDPNLKLNEVGIPLDMAKDLYKPFIIKELLNQGLAGNEFEAMKKWKSLDFDVKKVVNDIAEDRPMILNRQPSLHKFSIMAMKPIIKETQDGMAVRSIHLNPLIVTAYNADFDGDTMAVHVPITEKAKEEAKALMMPSNNLINPTNGQMIIEIRHEMALGIYYLTVKYQKPKGKAIDYNSYDKLRKDYFNGDIDVRQSVNISGQQGVTVGQALFNLLIPKQYRNFRQVWASGNINKLLAIMYKDAEKSGWKTMSSMDLSLIIDKIKDLGFKAATRSGVSIGTSDFQHVEQAKGIFEKCVAQASKENPNDPEKAEIIGWQKGEKAIEKLLGEGKILDADNPLNIMMASGARAKKDQIRRMMVSVGVGMDVTKNLVAPIKESHFSGLSPQDYFKLGIDSRKGISDRSVSTRDPGTLSREVWSAIQDSIIKENDCGTKEGVTIKISDSTIRGRYLAQDIIGDNGKIICSRGQIITDLILKDIAEDQTIRTAVIRSPLRCKTVRGICQKCYGAIPGTMQLAKIGTAVGVLASQALGEPVTQMTMNTFHSGGANSSATLGLPRIKDILNLSVDKGNGAVLSKISGKVTGIKSDTFNDIVYVNETAHKIPHGVNGDIKALRIKTGDNVSKGDFLTAGNVEDLMDGIDDTDSDVALTNADPKSLFKLKKEFYKGEVGATNADQLALQDTQDYLTNAMQYAFQKTVPNSLDRRHMETIVNKLTSKVKVTDTGNSHFLKGQIVDRNEAEAWNNKNSNSEEIKPIQFENKLYSKNSVVGEGHDNWFSNMGHQSVFHQIARGSTFGQVDKLDDPRSRLMSGKLLNVGEGYETDKNVANNISSSMYNFFSNNIPGTKKSTPTKQGTKPKKGLFGRLKLK